MMPKNQLDERCGLWISQQFLLQKDHATWLVHDHLFLRWSFQRKDAPKVLCVEALRSIGVKDGCRFATCYNTLQCYSWPSTTLIGHNIDLLRSQTDLVSLRKCFRNASGPRTNTEKQLIDIAQSSPLVEFRRRLQGACSGRHSHAPWRHVC